MSSLKSKAVKSVKHTSLAMIITSLLQVLQLIILGRILGPAVFGVIALVQIVIQFAQMYIDMGLSDAIIQKEKISKKNMSGLYWFSLGIGLVMCLSMIAVAPLVAMIFQQEQLTGLIRMISLSFLILPFGLQFQTIASKHLEFEKISRYEIISSFFGVMVTISAAVFFSAGAWSLVFGHISASLIRTIPWVIIGFKNPETRPELTFSWEGIREYVVFGAYRLGTTTINFFNTKVDQILVGIMMGPQILGFYSMAMNLIMQPIQKLNPMINRVAFPVFSQIQNDRARLQKGYLFIIKLIMTINAPMYAGLAVLAPYVIPLLLGEEWTRIVIIVQILCVYALFRAMGNPSGSLLIATGKIEWSFYWQLFQLFIIPVVLYFSSLTGSIVMVALSMTLLRFVLFFVNYAIRLRFIIGNCLGEMLKAIFTPIGHSLLMVGILQWVISRMENLPYANILIISIPAGIFIYMLLILIFQKELIREIKGFFITKKIGLT
ncbi:MOP flippase family protein [Planococcus salinarum]|uniref:MOP flippase family protein n=1 Tax=Planococcus salinarum TaxID=622695 RepID=UPI000E3D398D|nr:MOP flippase family protein [Planococcus salinarum]TAA66473.1 MOP flippase family protein [Planococcus salinarum]